MSSLPLTASMSTSAPPAASSNATDRDEGAPCIQLQIHVIIKSCRGVSARAERIKNKTPRLPPQRRPRLAQAQYAGTGVAPAHR